MQAKMLLLPGELETIFGPGQASLQAPDLGGIEFGAVRKRLCYFLFRSLGPLDVDFPRALERIGQYGRPTGINFGKAAAYRHSFGLPGPHVTKAAGNQVGDELGVTGKHSQLTFRAGDYQRLYFVLVDALVRREQSQHERLGHNVLPSGRHLAGLLLGVFNGTHHVEGLLGQMIQLTVQDLAEARDGILQFDVYTGSPGEGLGHVERL
jgi:hypothetical protein